MYLEEMRWLGIVKALESQPQDFESLYMLSCWYLDSLFKICIFIVGKI